MNGARRFAGILVLSWIALFVFGGCEQSERQMHSRGFHLPNRDPDVGQQLFVTMKCHLCHTVSGVELPDFDIPALPKIEIGGKVNRVRSYGELVTSIISPEHVVSEQWLKILSEQEGGREDVFSPMPVFNDQMTVQQLADLAAFLYVAFEKNELDSFEYYPVIP